MRIQIRDMSFDLRGLTRGELRTLDREGIDPDEVMKLKDAAEREKVMDRIILMAAPDAPLDDLTPAEHMETFLRIAPLTYLGDGDLKKLHELQISGSKGASKTATRAKKGDSSNRGGARK